MAIVEVIHKVISSTVNFIFLKSVITPSCFEKEHRVRHFLDSCLMTQVCIGIFFFPIRHYVIKYSCLFTVERRLLTCCYPVVICPLRDLSPKVVTLVFLRKKKIYVQDRRAEFFPRSTIYYSCRWFRRKWCARLHFTVCWFTASAACASILPAVVYYSLKGFRESPIFQQEHEGLPKAMES